VAVDQSIEFACGLGAKEFAFSLYTEAHFFSFTEFLYDVTLPSFIYNHLIEFQFGANALPRLENF
jgi:hypothetical protein